MKEKEIEELIDKLIENSKTATLRFPRNRLESEIVSETRTALLSKFRELEDYKAAFIVLWDFCKEQTHKQIELVKRAEQAEEQVENAKKDKDEAVKSVRIQYDSVCDMFHKREREYEDRITDLNNALINQLETGKQKTIYINQLEKAKRELLLTQNERLKNDGWVKRVYQLEHQLEDMKCCGNCKHSDTDWDKKVVCCLVEEKETKAYKYCDNWQSDNLTQKERET